MQLTIFTPAYNRAYTLGALYESILVQGHLDNIEWLIFDDGSTDDTRQLVAKFIDEAKINIRYICQDNQGKMQAHNNGVINAKGEYFICVDSDDFLADGAVDIIFDGINMTAASDCVGIIAMKGKDAVTPIQGKHMPKIEYSNLAGVYANGYDGDTALVFKTAIIGQYLFPKIEGEKFIPEAYIYDQIDEKYNYLVVNKILVICEYLTDGFSGNVEKLILNNPRGWGLWYNQCLLKGNTISKCKNAIRYNSVMVIVGEKNYIKKSNNKILTALMLLPGKILAGRRKRSSK